MDSILSSANTIVVLVITFAGGCVWLGKFYASHKEMEEEIRSLRNRCIDLDKKLDRVIGLLIAQNRQHAQEFGD